MYRKCDVVVVDIPATECTYSTWYVLCTVYSWHLLYMPYRWQPN